MSVPGVLVAAYGPTEAKLIAFSLACDQKKLQDLLPAIDASCYALFSGVVEGRTVCLAKVKPEDEFVALDAAFDLSLCDGRRMIVRTLGSKLSAKVILQKPDDACAELILNLAHPFSVMIGGFSSLAPLQVLLKGKPLDPDLTGLDVGICDGDRLIVQRRKPFRASWSFAYESEQRTIDASSDLAVGVAASLTRWRLPSKRAFIHGDSVIDEAVRLESLSPGRPIEIVPSRQKFSFHTTCVISMALECGADSKCQDVITILQTRPAYNLSGTRIARMICCCRAERERDLSFTCAFHDPTHL
jgi:hypothetical protein